MTSKESGPNTVDAEPAGNVDNPMRSRRGGRKDIPAHVGVKSNTPPVDQPKQGKGGRKTKAQRQAEILAAIKNRHEKETAGKNAEHASRLTHAKRELPGEGPAQTLECEQTEQEMEPEVDGDLGDSRDINDEQADDADNLPVVIDAGNATLPASYEHAKQALATCSSIDECKDWEGKAAALAAYGRMAGDTELERHALRIRAYAARRAGELLRAIPGQTGGRPPREKNSGGYSPEFPNVSQGFAEKPMSPRAAAVKDAGMSEHQAKEAMRVAAVPKDDFERQVEGPKPPTVATLAKQGKRKPPTEPDADARRAQADDHKNRSIGADTVARALKKWKAEISPDQQSQIEANTPERRAFANAIERLPPNDAVWACDLASYVKQEACNIEKAAGRMPEHDDGHVGGDDQVT
jgi:hypothetical protein